MYKIYNADCSKIIQHAHIIISCEYETNVCLLTVRCQFRKCTRCTKFGFEQAENNEWRPMECMTTFWVKHPLSANSAFHPFWVCKWVVVIAVRCLGYGGKDRYGERCSLPPTSWVLWLLDWSVAHCLLMANGFEISASFFVLWETLLAIGEFAFFCWKSMYVGWFILMTFPCVK